MQIVNRNRAHDDRSGSYPYLSLFQFFYLSFFFLWIFHFVQKAGKWGASADKETRSHSDDTECSLSTPPRCKNAKQFIKPWATIKAKKYKPKTGKKKTLERWAETILWQPLGNERHVAAASLAKPPGLRTRLGLNPNPRWRQSLRVLGKKLPSFS